jgi:hypothetical protein
MAIVYFITPENGKWYQSKLKGMMGDCFNIELKESL